MGWPTGVEHVHFDTIDSTNAQARRCATQMDAPIWISADEQTAGTGRRGRAWSTAKGNFAASLLMPTDAPPDQLALRSFVAALALRDALGALLPGCDITFKWPNDVLLDGRKLAGILLENLGTHLIVGIGVNTTVAPEQDKMINPTIAATHLHAQVDNAALLIALATAFAKREAQLTHSGFESIRSDWLAHAAKLGETITARTMRGDITGVFETLDAQGQLILQHKDQRHMIAAADVFFDRTQAYASCD